MERGRMKTREFLAVYESVPPAYYEWMFDRVRPVLRDPVLELGAGPGLITGWLLEAGFSVTALEREEPLVERLREHFAGRPACTLICADLLETDLAALPGAPFGTVVCLNLLEHLEDDRRALDACYRALRPGGTLAVLVPAHPGLFGSMDRRFGHRRRYRRDELIEKMSAAGFAVRTEWFNLLGILGWWWRFRVRQSEEFSPRQNRVYATMIPGMKTLEAIRRPPTGLSLIAFGAKAE